MHLPEIGLKHHDPPIFFLEFIFTLQKEQLIYIAFIFHTDSKSCALSLKIHCHDPIYFLYQYRIYPLHTVKGPAGVHREYKFKLKPPTATAGLWWPVQAPTYFISKKTNEWLVLVTMKHIYMMIEHL